MAKISALSDATLTETHIVPVVDDALIGGDPANANKKFTIAALRTRLQAILWPVAAGGTGAANAADARTNLGLGTAATLASDTDGALAASSDTRIATQKAVKTYVDQIVAAQDAMVFKGAIDCSSNPNYPAADRGHTYRVSVAGKIGGASGVNVEVGDLLMCLTDGTASGNQATVGTSWNIAQVNLDGTVIGPASVTDGRLALFDGASGKLIKQHTGAPGDAATKNVGTTAGTVAAGDDSRIVGAAQDAFLGDILNNGNGQINQAGVTSCADGEGGHDQWIALTESGAIGVSTLADVADGLRRMIRLTQSQVTAQRFGYGQLLAGQRCKDLRGALVTLLIELRHSATANIRYAILETTAAENAPPRDPINNWASGTYTAGNFFIASDLIVRHVASVAVAANTLTAVPPINLTLGSTFHNLFVVVWTEGAAAQNATLDFAVNLRRSYANFPLLFRSTVQELFECKPYFWVAGAGFIGTWWGATSPEFGMQFSPRMIKPPVVTTISGNISVAQVGVATRTASGVTVAGYTSTENGADVRLDGFSGATAKDAAIIITDNCLIFDSRIGT